MEEGIEGVKKKRVYRRKKDVSMVESDFSSVKEDIESESIDEEISKSDKVLERYYEATQEQIRNEEVAYSSSPVKKISPFRKKINDLVDSYVLTYKSLSPEKIFSFWLFSIIGLIFLILGINTLSQSLQIVVPTYGGTLNEGLVGVPRYTNPIISNTDSGKDLSALVYSGLLKKDEAGDIVNDLAESVEVSEDQLSYTVKINPKAEFHDGVKLTADDVVFTINKIKDPSISSQHYIEFEGVSVEKIDNYTLVFRLKKPFFYFEEALTVGILPKHIWDGLSSETFTLSENNLNPIGSGPYKISNVSLENNLPKKFELSYFNKYLHGRPYITKINLYIYQNQTDLLNALKNGNIDSTAYLDKSLVPEVLNNNKIITRDLPNVYYLAFNPSKNINLSNKETRKALADSINKQEIINKISNGYAKKVDVVFGNIPENYSKNDSPTSTTWIKDKITEINITTADIEELKLTAEEVANYWRNLGINVNIKVFSTGDIAEVIKNRDFEILLFGSVIEHDTDLYSYLHSSQRSYPGLNITGYTSKNMDTSLEILKNSVSESERYEALEKINEEILNETPQIPLYSNNLNYVIKNKNIFENIESEIPKKLENKSERFVNINKWYMYKEKIWRFSYLKNLISKLQAIIH